MCIRDRYSGDGVADTVTLPSSVVTYEDPLEDGITLNILVDKGSVSVVTVHPDVSEIGPNSSSLTLIGKAANLQTTLDSGLKFHSTTATTGDVTITHHISVDVAVQEQQKQFVQKRQQNM